MSTSTSAARCSAGSVARARQHGRRRSSATAAAGGVVDRARRGVRATRGRRTSSRSSGSGSARRTLAARIRSRQALTTTRCSQVVTAASPRKRAGPSVRRDHAVLEPVGGVVGVAHGAQRHRPEPVAVPGNSVAKASGSPSTWAASRSASVRSSGDAAHVTLTTDLGDLAAEPARRRPAARSARRSRSDRSRASSRRDGAARAAERRLAGRGQPVEAVGLCSVT